MKFQGKLSDFSTHYCISGNTILDKEGPCTKTKVLCIVATINCLEGVLKLGAQNKPNKS